MLIKYLLNYSCKQRLTRLNSNYIGVGRTKDLETKWVSVIRNLDEQAQQSSVTSPWKSFVLSMFPYPSGKLHMGHLRVYTVSDVLCRYKSMCGESTIFPMGWDAFGLPAENAAIDHGRLPLEWTESNIKCMREQLDNTMLLNIDWKREISTCDPNYYKWTQWLFLQLYKAGLAYQRSAFVNWDPVDKTVLADELVDQNGISWRSGAKVERLPLRQWYFKTTAFSESLLKGLEILENDEWRDVINMQRGWLGELNGTQVDFDLFTNDSEELDDSFNRKDRLVIFTKYPSLVVADLISFIRIKSDSVYFSEIYRKPEDERNMNSSRKLIIHSLRSLDAACDPNKLSISSSSYVAPGPEILSLFARHPFTGRMIPLVRDECSENERHISAYSAEIVFSLDQQVPDFIQDSMNYSTSCGRLIQPGNPICIDLEELDKLEIREKQQLIISTTIKELDGKNMIEAIDPSMKLLKSSNRGGYWCDEFRTDWLISRQRYWGTPIPIVHCASCGAVPVPENQLPVRLPPIIKSFKRGDSPLKDNLDWLRTPCPKCGKPAERETDTMDTFVDSSWYYLRYLDPKNSDHICSPTKAKEALPVDVYIGGIEHAIRHLYYARFMAHFLHSVNILPCKEPFKRFLPVGLVMGKTLMDPQTGRFVPISNAKQDSDKQWVESNTGIPLKMYWDKMSKSKYNGIDPQEVVQRYGLDLVRITMLANVGPHRTRNWQESEVIQGVKNWLSKMDKLVRESIVTSEQYDQSPPLSSSSSSFSNCKDPLLVLVPDFIETRDLILSKVNESYNDKFLLSSVIARLQQLTELLRKSSLGVGGPGPHSQIYLRTLADLIVMLAPIAPIYASEFWSGIQLACSNCPSLIKDNNWPYNIENFVLQQPFPMPNSSNQTRINTTCSVNR